jgi:hypothetical protein
MGTHSAERCVCMKKYFAAIVVLAAVASCGPRYIYPHLEWLVPWYISDYISLDDRQKNMLMDRLQKQLDWHCRTQLANYAQLLRAVGRDFESAARPIEYSRLQFYMQKLMALRRELLQQIAVDITDLLQTASDAQVKELFDNLKAQNKKLQAQYVDLDPLQLDENRRKRMVKRVKYWISTVTREQQDAVSSWSSQLVPIAGDWLKNREFIQAEARRLLARAKNDPASEKSLQELIADPERMRTAAYQKATDLNTDITLKFIMRMERLMTPGQRSFFIKRIESLAADFDKLSCDPEDIPIGVRNGDYRDLRFGCCQGDGFYGMLASIMNAESR